MEAGTLTQFSMSLDRFFQRQAARVVTLEAVGCLVLVGFVDYITGWELSVSLLYALIILLVAWRVDRNTALAFAVTSAAIWCVANAKVNPYASQWAYAWATFTRLAYFVFVAVGGSALRAYQRIQPGPHRSLGAGARFGA